LTADTTSKCPHCGSEAYGFKVEVEEQDDHLLCLNCGHRDYIGFKRRNPNSADLANRRELNEEISFVRARMKRPVSTRKKVENG
jgi:Zn ribbon nucleic-acid-binding protein